MNLAPFEAAFTLALESSTSASVLVIIVALIQLTLGRRIAPAWRFLLWTPVLLRLLIPVLPESSFSIFNAWRLLNPPEIPALTTQPFEIAPLAEPAVIATAPVISNELVPAAPVDWKARALAISIVLWASIALLLLLRLFLGSIWLASRLRRESTSSDPLLDALRAAAAELGVDKLPRLRESSLVESPALFGLFRPTLLLPRGLATRLNESEIRHVFLHELAHVQRRDLPFNWLMAIAQALHWFNPLVWLLFRQMRIERELACDAMVLRAASSEDPKAYGRTILHLLEGVTSRTRITALIGIAEEKHSAQRRLQQIATFQPGHRRYWLALPLLLVVAVAGLTNAQNPVASSPSKESSASPRPAQTALRDRLSQLQIDRISISEKSLADAVAALKQKLPADLQEVQFLFFQHTNITSGPDGTYEVNASGYITSPIESTNSPARHFLLSSKGQDGPEPGGRAESALDFLDQIKRASEKPIDYQINDGAVIFFEPPTQSDASQVIKDARLLMEMGLLDEAEAKLHKAIKHDPEDRPAHYYLSLLKERRYSQQQREHQAATSERIVDVSQSWNRPPNPYARTNAVHHSPQREAIAKKLDEIVLPRFWVPGPIRLSEVVRVLGQEAKKHDPQNRGVNLIISSVTPQGVPYQDVVPVIVEDYLVQLDPPLLNVRLREVLDAITRSAHPPTADHPAGPIQYSIEDYAVVFASQPARKEEPLYTRTFRLDPGRFLPDLQQTVLQQTVGPIETMPEMEKVQTALRNHFSGFGIDFPLTAMNPSDKAIFYNDRTGVLFARATLAELSLMEKAVEDFMLSDRQMQGQPADKNEPLHTRTYRLNPKIFLSNLEQKVGPINQIPAGRQASSLQAAVQKFFAQSGVDFAPVYQGIVLPGQPPPTKPQKAIFFNDQTGLLFVRATMEEMDKVEKALQVLNTAPLQVRLDSRFLSLAAADASAFLEFLQQQFGRERTVFTAAETQEILEFAEKTLGAQVLAAPRVSTLSGRAARITVEAPRIDGPQSTPSGRAARTSIEGPQNDLTIDLHPEFRPDSGDFKLITSAYREPAPENKARQVALLYDGQTLLQPVQPSQNADAQPATEFCFITLRLIDSTGEPLSPPDKLRTTIPPQDF